jgi:Na+/proline symporter
MENFDLFELFRQAGKFFSADIFFTPLGMFVTAYWLYCLFLAFSQSLLLSSKISARDYFIAGGSLNMLMFIAAATATSFSGWTFSSHPGAIYEYGFSAAFASFYAITIPLSGVFFLKRQWMLGKRCGFVTPGEMFYAYFKSDIMRYLVLVVALLFSILYLALQLRASGYLFNILTDGKLSVESGTLLLSTILFIYVVVGGLRTVAYIDTMQLLLKAAGIMTLGYVVWHYSGLSDMERLANFHRYFHDTAKYFTVPEGFWYANKAVVLKETGSYWTATFIFTFLFALMGIQTSPAFTMWAFATKNPNAFGYQQVFASSLVMGFILIFYTAIIGIGSHFLGADYALNENMSNDNNILGFHLKDRDLLKASTTPSESLVPTIIRMTLDISPFLMGILAMMALAAVQSTAASYMSTMGSMLSRDLLKNGWCRDRKFEQQEREALFIFTLIIAVVLVILSNFSVWSLIFIAALITPIATYAIVKAIARAIRYPMTFSDSWQKWSAAFFTFSITIIAIAVALGSTDALAFMGALAVAYGVQMMPALIAICWWSYLTEWGVIVGLIVGLITVTLTELTPELFSLAIGQWPGTIHSAAWGFGINIILAIAVSTVQIQLKWDTEAEHRKKFHRFLNDPFLKNMDKPNYQPKNQPNWRLILGVVFLWAFCAFGLARWGNTLFGDPTDVKTWLFGIPLLWTWQIGWWAIGVFMMYWLAFKQNLAYWSEEKGWNEIQPLRLEEESKDIYGQAIRRPQLDISESKDLYCQNIYEKE